MFFLPPTFGARALKRRQAPRRRKYDEPTEAEAEAVLQQLEADVDAAIASGDTATMERLLQDVFYSDDGMATGDQMTRLRALADRLRIALGGEPLVRPWD